MVERIEIGKAVADAGKDEDRSVAILRAFVDGTSPAPPPEKKYWWPLPKPGAKDAAEFQKYQQFQRIAWHWAEINRVIVGALAALPRANQHFVRLEDLQGRPSAVRDLFQFLALPYRDDHFAAFARPHNVNRPEDRLLTVEQRDQFDAIAGEALAHFGYADSEEYLVNYG
jgi:hypothetical protein